MEVFRWHTSFTSFAKKLARTRRDLYLLALKDGERYTETVPASTPDDTYQTTKEQIDEKIETLLAYFDKLQKIGGANVVIRASSGADASYFGIEVSDHSWRAMTAEKTIEAYPGLNDLAKKNMITPDFLAY